MQAKANRSMYGRNTTKHLTGLQTLWASTNWRFMRIWTTLSNTTFRSSGNWLGKSITRNTNRCFDNYTWWEVRFYLLKLFSKRKKQKKKKAILTRRTGGKTKRKRNKSRRVAGQTQPLGEATIFALPLCRSLLVGWCGGCPPYLCSLFILFLINSNQRKGTKNT